MTPYSYVHRLKTAPPINNFKPFGCEAYIHIPREIRIGSAGPKADKCYFIGYGKNKKAWRVWIPEQGKIEESADITFNEGCTLGNSEYAQIKMQNLPKGRDK